MRECGARGSARLRASLGVYTTMRTGIPMCTSTNSTLALRAGVMAAMDSATLAMNSERQMTAQSFVALLVVGAIVLVRSRSRRR